MAVFIDRVLFSGQSADETKSDAVNLRGEVRDVTVYIKTGAGVSAGVVTIEEADDPDYTGSWSNISDVTVSSASAQYAVHLTGTYKAVRVRISTAITGGSVSARIIAAEA